MDPPPRCWTRPGCKADLIDLPASWPPAVAAIGTAVIRTGLDRGVWRKARLGPLDVMGVIDGALSGFSVDAPASLAAAVRLAADSFGGVGVVGCAGGRGDGRPHGVGAIAGERRSVGLAAGTIPGDPGAVKRSLLLGSQVAIGLTVGRGWDDLAAYSRGIVPLPGWGESGEAGAVFLVDGWNDPENAWLIRHPLDRCFGRDGLGVLPQWATTTPWACHEVVSLDSVWLT